MYDVIIIGGSYAGLAAAMTMGRSIRKTLVIDSGKPCNAQTPYSHNFITQDGEKPGAIASKAKQQVLAYPSVNFKEDLVNEVSGHDGNFKVSTRSNEHYQAKKIIFATGVKDIMPEIEGFQACWGIAAIHCPYCHGYEVRDKKTGILINDENALNFAKLILNWTDDLTIYSNGKARFNSEEIKNLGVHINEKAIQHIEHNKGYMSHLQFQDGSKSKLDALYHRTAYEQHCKIPEQLGCEITETGHIKVNEFQQTSIEGIYAVGDSSSPLRSVTLANASGAKAAFTLNHELIMANY
ncbi:NAD(P)/FAD-dependent oxidoreductase [Zunongwangia endophytica]|uniref:NAD(P)/FAD-dependent oxidoreductase n=1 Tax=Zunongwangia endophytica TaxID=1808945 RepID=A0ABV8H7Y5_9FLAO|nr:NAD(P)/FAD-dependent oxidoreductase [Zunongwangia endophytica]MDN3595569.1 NAD(P)/FAD-dependent oxidoreductase [Zunongwangia endophytica]